MRSMFVLTMAVVVAAAACSVGFAAAKVGDKAPDFKAKGIDGTETSLKSALKDAKAVVVCFTCNQCPVAVAYEDRFIEFSKQYGKKGVKFIALNCNNASENLEKMKQRAEEKGFNFPYVFDASGDAAREYGAKKTPELFVIDGSGKLVYHGSFDDKQNNPSKPFVADAVDAVLAGKEVPVSKTNAFGCGIKLK